MNFNDTKYKYIFDELREYMFIQPNIKGTKSVPDLIPEPDPTPVFLEQIMMPKQKPIPTSTQPICMQDQPKEMLQKPKSILSKSKKSNIQSNLNIFFPREKDSLFWCFFMMKFGDEKYELSPKHLVEEKKIKIDYVEKIRENKPLLKQYKFASLTHIENQLVNEFKIDIHTFFSLCVLENINIMYIHKKSFYELILNDEEIVYVVQRIDTPLKYGLKNMSFTEIEQYKTTLFKMENIDKPIKSVSSYKLAELQDFCQKLEIDILNKETNKKKNKNELYESIIQYF